MKVIECTSCGSKDLYEEDGYRICRYCGTRHLISRDEKPEKATIIGLSGDVDRLLKVCREDPSRAKKCAERILEIDPSNEEAKRILESNEEAKRILENSKNGNVESGGCYIATAVYGSYDCPQVWTLRRYRDYTLAETWYGRAFIRTYYAISPTIVKCFGKKDWFRNMWKPKLDWIVKHLNGSGVADTPYQDNNW